MKENRQTPIEALGVSTENLPLFFDLLAKRMLQEEVSLDNVPEDVVQGYRTFVGEKQSTEEVRDAYTHLIASLTDNARGAIDKVLAIINKQSSQEE